MSTSELIKKLETYPPDMPVYIMWEGQYIDLLDTTDDFWIEYDEGKPLLLVIDAEKYKNKDRESYQERVAVLHKELEK